jgi:ribosomal protein L22
MIGDTLKREVHKQPHADIIKEICEKIECNEILDAKNILKAKWEHKKLKNNGRQNRIEQHAVM